MLRCAYKLTVVLVRSAMSRPSKERLVCIFDKQKKQCLLTADGNIPIIIVEDACFSRTDSSEKKRQVLWTNLAAAGILLWPHSKFTFYKKEYTSSKKIIFVNSVAVESSDLYRLHKLGDYVKYEDKKSEKILAALKMLIQSLSGSGGAKKERKKSSKKEKKRSSKRLIGIRADRRTEPRLTKLFPSAQHLANTGDGHCGWYAIALFTRCKVKEKQASKETSVDRAYGVKLKKATISFIKKNPGVLVWASECEYGDLSQRNLHLQNVIECDETGHVVVKEEHKDISLTIPSWDNRAFIEEATVPEIVKKFTTRTHGLGQRELSSYVLRIVTLLLNLLPMFYKPNKARRVVRKVKVTTVPSEVDLVKDMADHLRADYKMLEDEFLTDVQKQTLMTLMQRNNKERIFFDRAGFDLGTSKYTGQDMSKSKKFLKKLTFKDTRLESEIYQVEDFLSLIFHRNLPESQATFLAYDIWPNDEAKQQFAKQLHYRRKEPLEVLLHFNGNHYEYIYLDAVDSRICSTILRASDEMRFPLPLLNADNIVEYTGGDVMYKEHTDDELPNGHISNRQRLVSREMVQMTPGKCVVQSVRRSDLFVRDGKPHENDAYDAATGNISDTRLNVVPTLEDLAADLRGTPEFVEQFK